VGWRLKGSRVTRKWNIGKTYRKDEDERGEIWIVVGNEIKTTVQTSDLQILASFLNQLTPFDDVSSLSVLESLKNDSRSLAERENKGDFVEVVGRGKIESKKG